MKKTIYLIVLVLITVACVIFGTYRGAKNWFGYTFNTNSEDLGNVSTMDSDVQEAFHKIEVDVDVIDVTVEQGTDYTVSYEANERLVPQYSVANDTLTVKQKQKDINVFGMNNVKAKMTITVPDQTALDDITITSSVGDVRISNITTSSFNCKVDTGDVKTENSALGKTTVDASVGDITLDQVTLEDTDVSSDVGDVDMTVLQSADEFNRELSADVGDVVVNNNRSGSDEKVSTGGSYTMTVSSDVGDVKISFQ